MLLARRDRLVVALAAGTGVLLLLTLLMNYEPNSSTIGRFHGHARNFALFALVLALGIRLAGLRAARWRYTAGAVVVALVTWPTAADVVRNAGQAVGRNGIELANAQPTQTAARLGQRFVLQRLPSDRIATYIRNNTTVDARVFSPNPHQMTYATGRPNASSFAGLILRPADPRNHISGRPQLSRAGGHPTARLRIRIHAPDEWVEGLPDEAACAAQRSKSLRVTRPRRL